MRAVTSVAAAGFALALALGGSACGDDGAETDPGAPGGESEIDGSEAGTGGDSTSSSSVPAGSPPGDMTGGGATGGGTQGNQVPPAG